MDIVDLMQKFGVRHGEVKGLITDQGQTLAGMGNRIQDLEQKAARRGLHGGGGLENKSMGAQLVESDGFKSMLANGGKGSARIELKATTLLSTPTSGGSLVAPQIITDPIMLPRMAPAIRQLVAPGTTTSNAIWFPRQTDRINNATGVLEGAQKPQSELDFIVQQVPVVTIAHFILASRQILDDAQALQSVVDAELRYGLQVVEENQLLNGNGTSGNMLGIMPQAAAYRAPFVVTGETDIDRVRLAIAQLQLALYRPNGIVMNPLDWAKIEMNKDAMGRYIVGNPQGAAPSILWNLPVVDTILIPQGQFLVGAFRTGAQIFDRLQTEVLISTEDATNFQQNLITIRAEERLALCVYRPGAFVTGTLPQ